MTNVDRAIETSRVLGRACDKIEVADDIFVYNPLSYARAGNERYLSLYGDGKKRAFWLGMNPGPFGMMQTGVPFGEIAAVRDFLRVEAEVRKPRLEHPKRPIEGFACERSEVSGRRLWGLVAEAWRKPEAFFSSNIVWNYCPLAFLDARGANVTPDKLPLDARKQIAEVCDHALDVLFEIWQPDILIGIGGYAEKQLRAAANRQNRDVKVGQILHPSPASPRANRDWAGQVRVQLEALGVAVP